ncbi:hypothetical protein JCM10908_003204 [Rhodotorula pacifica]|uniref:uncharacterized protein n=1 Tax=Rhodotorula pacifica TaxID=1495444 RepID=UPI00317DEA5A
MAATFRDLPNNVSGRWWSDRSLRRNLGAAAVCWLGSFVIGYGLQSMESWNSYFDTPTGNRLGIISAVSYLPSLIMLPGFSLMCDYWGRRMTALAGCIFVVVGAVIGAVAKNEGMLIAGRAIVGPAGSLVALATNLLCNEVLHPRFRSVGSAFFLVFYYIGSIASSLVTFGVVAGKWEGEWSWRLPTLLQALGPLVIMALLPFLPESPRFLIARGQREKALRVLAHHHANDKEDDALVLFEMDEIETAMARERVNKQGFASFLKTKGNRHRLLILLTSATGSQGSGNAVISYYLTPVLRLAGITDPVQQTGLNLGLQVFNLLMAGGGAALVERLGRRPLWMISTGSMLLCFAGLLGTSAGFDTTGKASVGFASVAFIFLTYGAYDIAWTPLAYSYVTEILPYSMRASGMSFFIWVQNATLCANQWINPIGLEAIGWKFYFVFIATLIFFNIMIYFYFIETKGLSLEEVALLFDGNAGTTLEQKKEAADAQIKLDRKQRETQHLEEVDTEKESV